MSSVIISKRSFLTGLGSIIAAPAIVRASSLMPVKSLSMPFEAGPDVPPVIISMIRSISPELIAKEICSVQPMTGLHGNIFPVFKARYSEAETL